MSGFRRAKTRWPLPFQIWTQFMSGLSPFEYRTGRVFEWSLYLVNLEKLWSSSKKILRLQEHCQEEQQLVISEAWTETNQDHDTEDPDYGTENPDPDLVTQDFFAENDDLESEES
jgi:hypothetical protein